GLAGHRILWDGADVVLLLELLKALRVALFIGVEVVDRGAHLAQIAAQRRLARLVLRVLDVRHRDGRKDADDRDDDDQLGDRESSRALSHSTLARPPVIDDGTASPRAFFSSGTSITR